MSAWQSHEGVYEHTVPTIRPRTPLSPPPPGDAARYALEGASDAKRPRHLLLLPGASTADDAVPALAADAEAWRSFSAPASAMGGLTPEMVVVADMLYTYGPQLALLLSDALIARNCHPCRFVSSVIERVRNEEIGAGVKARMLDALEAVLRPFMPAGASLDELMGEWMRGVIWMDIRTACAHPLGHTLQEGGLGELRQAVSTQAGYSAVRLLVPTLLNAGEQLLPPPAPKPGV